MKALMFAISTVCQLTAVLVGWSSCAAAEGSLEIATSYPRDTVSGEATAMFAGLVQAETNGQLMVRPTFDDRRRTDNILRGESGVDAGALFAGDLLKVNAIFALSVLPFEVTSIEQAQRLSMLARPAYQQAFAAEKLVLLAVVPWPPTGLWSRQVIANPSDLNNLRMRTYDASSRAVFRKVGAQADMLPITDALARLGNGQLDAVMSSGDGEAGRVFSQHLRNFEAIHYAYPLSFLVVRRRSFDGLSAPVQDAVYRAAERTESLAWQALSARELRNYEQMREQGVTLLDPIGPELSVVLRRAGQAHTARWLATVSPKISAPLKEFREWVGTYRRMEGETDAALER
ncbi:TRAP transporter substrate-binding protein DctP [Burkholderia alba]|uniref:TRAP transporter substrate-binding protein DctP n=1 Tax=Burkholderia alba TaxID=2683677 RepID=UPI002B05C95B|nr:TRAP transporter substrate-binding protein DctP [Burkholderia alba]